MEAIIAALITVVVTNLVLLWQLIVFRKTLHIQAQAALTGKWNTVSMLEISDPDFHRMLMNPRSLELTAKCTPAQMKERAFAHLVFDVLSDQFRSRTSGVDVGAETYLTEVLSNPKMQQYWRDFGVRDAWRDDPFQTWVDNALSRLA